MINNKSIKTENNSPTNNSSPDPSFNKIGEIEKELLKEIEIADETREKAALLCKLADRLMNADPIKAKKYAEIASGLAKSIDYKKGISDCLRIMGVVNYNRADYPEANEYLHKSLKISEEIDDNKGISRCLNNLGLLHQEQRDFDTSLEYFLESLDIKIKLSDSPKSISYTLINIANDYWYLKDYPKALEFYYRGLQIAKEIGDKKAISATLKGIGMVYRAQSEYSKALDFYLESLDLSKEIGDNKAISGCLINIGNLSIDSGDFDKAIDSLNKGLELAIEIDALNWVQRAYFSLSRVCANSRKYKKALEYHKLYKETGDTIFNQQKSEQIANLRIKYETEKKEQEIEIWRKASITDPLTKIPNRMGLWEKINAEIKKFSGEPKPFVLCILDIDKFKLFNDEHGHDCGDSVLKAIADIMKNSTRQQDFVGRWGGEEFLIILPETDISDGYEVIERVRKSIEGYSHHFKGKVHSITASFGMSIYKGDRDIDTVIKDADDALYRAKTGGRNRCEIAGNI